MAWYREPIRHRYTLAGEWRLVSELISLRL